MGVTMIRTRLLDLISLLLFFTSNSISLARRRRPQTKDYYVPRNAQKITWDNKEVIVESPGFQWVLFGATWCPHTQNALPTFDEAVRKIQHVKGYRINYSYVYTDEESSKNPRNQTQSVGLHYKVKEYPNIRMYYNGKYMHRFKKHARQGSLPHYRAYLDILVDYVLKRRRG